MAQEDHSQRHSNTSSGGGGSGGCGSGGGGVYDHHRLSKKFKQKKVPQRGLGVAQLEKIRLEEQQKVDSSSILPSTKFIISHSNSSDSLAFRSQSLIPSPPPCHNNLSFSPSYGPFSPATNFAGGGESGRLTGGLDHRGEFGFMKNARLPYESHKTGWPPPNVVQERSQQYKQPCSSSMMNVSTGASSASVLNYQMEPPSNKSYCGNNNPPPLWPEEDKIVGTKRWHHFVIEDAPIPKFHCKLPSSFVSPISGSIESFSRRNGVPINFEPSYPVIREGNSSAISEQSSKKATHGNGGGLNGDFLRLAPPEKDSGQLSTKLSLKYQEEDSSTHVSGQGGSLKQQALISFFPPAKTTDSGLAINSETGDCIDLNLKL